MTDTLDLQGALFDGSDYDEPDDIGPSFPPPSREYRSPLSWDPPLMFGGHSFGWALFGGGGVCKCGAWWWLFDADRCCPARMRALPAGVAS